MKKIYIALGCILFVTTLLRPNVGIADERREEGVQAFENFVLPMLIGGTCHGGS